MENYKKISCLKKTESKIILIIKSKETNLNYILKNIISEKTEILKDKYNEVQIMKKFNHPNILKFHEAFLARKPQQSLNIIIEFAEQGDLFSKIEKNKNLGEYFPENQIIDWFIQICLALNEIHSKKIIHRKLNTKNIFISKNNQIKIGEFEKSKKLDYTLQNAKTLCFDSLDVSPEIIKNIPYNNKTDIWSLGIILYEMITLNKPFYANNLSLLYSKIEKGEFNKIECECNENLKKLISLLFQVNPNKRPSIEDILSKLLLFIF